MKKGLLKTLLLTFFAVLLLGTVKIKAGQDMGTLSKDNPCVYVRITLQKSEDFYGGFFKVSGDAKDIKMSIVNLSKGDVSLKTAFADITGGEWKELKTVTFKKGKKKSEYSLSDLNDGGMFFVEVRDPKLYDQEEAVIGICIYSEALGGTKHDFTKLVLSKDELTLQKGKSVTLKVTLDKSLKKDGVIWSTSDKSVVTVSKKGKIKAKGGGGAVVTCTSKKDKNISAQCSIWVEGSSNDNKGQSGDVGEVKLTPGFNGGMAWETNIIGGKISSVKRYITLESNGYSGSLTIDFGCSDGIDSMTITVEKNKTYHIVYNYDVVENTRPDAKEVSIPVPVEIRGGNSIIISAKFTGALNKGYYSISEA